MERIFLITFGIMKAPGRQTQKCHKNYFYAGSLLITLISGAIGISVGLFVTFAFLVPEPVISQNTLVSVWGWLLLALSFLSLSSSYPAVKAVKKSVVSAVYSAWPIGAKLI